MPLSVGQMVLGRFRVVATSAAGSASVVDAVDEVSGSGTRLIALDAGGPTTTVDVARVLADADRFRIGSSSVARPIEAGWQDDMLVVAYERGPGVALEASAGFDAKIVATALARALAPLHDQGIAHGWLCPELVRIDGEQVTVEGFGFEPVARACFGARVAAEAQPARYCAPERRLGATTAPSPQADVYALGVMVSEVIAGRRAGAEEPPSPRGLGSTASDDLERIVGRALSRSPADRPDDVARWAGEVAAALAAPPAPSVPENHELPPWQKVEPELPTVPLAEPTVPIVEKARPAAPDVRVPPRAAAPPGFSNEPAPLSARTRQTSLLSVLAIVGGAIIMLFAIGGPFAYALLRSPAAAPGAATAPAPAGTGGEAGAAAIPPATEPSFDAGASGERDDAGSAREDAAAEPWEGGVSALADAGKPTPLPPAFGAGGEGQSVLPVGPGVPLWGSSHALVTVLVFGDLECPHTRRSYRVLEAIARAFPDEVRIAFRHRPLSIHPHAREAARVAAGIRQELGDTAFWRFVSAAAAGSDPATRSSLEAWAKSAGADAARVGTWLGKSETEQEVDRDLALAGLFDVRETPTFFVNGARFSGYREFFAMKPVIEKEIAQARGLIALGTTLGDLYAARVRKNLIGIGAEVVERSCPPTGGSPSRGASDALVTIVEFSDFQCPFCKRVQPTLETILAQHGGDVRLVWKHYPLPIHPRARPAAAFALEAFARGGPAKFWKVHDLLFDSQADLGEAALIDIAARAGLDRTALLEAARTKAHDPKIEADVALGQKLGVKGTPMFFVNGRALSGAQPLEKFSALVTEELEGARRLVASGTPRSRVYDAVCGAP